MKLFQWVKEWHLDISPKRGRSWGDKVPSSDLAKFNELYQHLEVTADKSKHANGWEEAAREKAKEAWVEKITSGGGGDSVPGSDGKDKSTGKRGPTIVMQDSIKRPRRSSSSSSPLGGGEGQQNNWQKSTSDVEDDSDDDHFSA